MFSKGTDNINERLDYVLQFKGEPKRVYNKTVKSVLYLLAHKGSSFNKYVVLNNPLQKRTVGNLFKNGSGIVSFTIFIGHVDENKKSSLCFLDVVYCILKILRKR